MGKSIEAVYECGVFKPLDPVELKEGQKVALSIEPLVLPADQADVQLSQWRQVYEGLTGRDIDEIERITRDRSRFLPDREEAP